MLEGSCLLDRDLEPRGVVLKLGPRTHFDLTTGRRLGKTEDLKTTILY